MPEQRPYEGKNQERHGLDKDGVKSIKRSDIHLPTRENIKRASIERGKEQELRVMRDRLYSRAETPKARERQMLSSSEVVSPEAVHARNQEEIHRIDEEIERPRGREQPMRPLPLTPAYDTTHTGMSFGPSPAVSPMPDMPQPKKIILKGYRTKIIAIAGIFFVVALILSSSFLFFGQNTISGNNIEITVQAPFTIGGGEELSLDVALTNRNAVAVESATLIVEYPSGTQAVDTQGKELFRDRISLGSIKPGEAVQTPVKAKIFGEENEEKVVNISVEYRVAGSNATFFKEAEPLKLKISSSPVVLSVDSIKEVSSGQEFTLTLSIASNSSTPLSDLLVQAEYPFGFDFSQSDPKPVKGQNLWSIASLPSGGKGKITITGVMVGGSAEERTFNFSVGVSSERDRFALSSVLTKASTEMTLTNPFVGLTVLTNGSTDKTVSVGQGDVVNVSITFKNTLSDTIYDGAIKTTLSGNGLDANTVNAAAGFYDSSTRTIIWDKGTVGDLGELAPGEQQTVDFSVRGVNLDTAKTPQVSYQVSVSGRRVSETRVPQELTNIESRTIRFESVVSLSSQELYSTGPFRNDGPMPPRAEAATQYTTILQATNGSNALAEATVSMTLPSYVTWANVISSGDTITYNANTREALWRIGNLDANASVDAAFQLSFLPSVSQVGTVPTLVGEQSLRATDRFTGTVVRTTAGALTTRLPEDPDPNTHTGQVLPKQ
jgi:hypothetical protein